MAKLRQGVCAGLAAFVCFSCLLMWSRKGRFPLRSGGRSKVLYTIGAAGSLLVTVPHLTTGERMGSTLHVVAAGLFVPCLAFPLLVAFRRYVREWRIHAMLQQLADPASAREERSRTVVKAYEAFGAEGRFGRYVQQRVRKLRHETTLRTSLRRLAELLLPCCLATAAFAAHFRGLGDDAAAREAWRDGGGGAANVGMWFAVYQGATVAGALGWSWHAIRSSARDNFGIRKEFEGAFYGSLLLLGAYLALRLAGGWAAGGEGGGDDDGGWAAAVVVHAVVVHVVGCMMLWPALRTFGCCAAVGGGARAAGGAAARVRKLSSGGGISSGLAAADVTGGGGGSSGGGLPTVRSRSRLRGLSRSMSSLGSLLGGGGGPSPRHHRQDNTTRAAAAALAVPIPGTGQFAEGQGLVQQPPPPPPPPAPAPIMLDEVLASEEGRRLFGQHLQSEFSVENLLFWKGCTEFRELAGAAEVGAGGERAVGGGLLAAVADRGGGAGGFGAGLGGGFIGTSAGGAAATLSSSGGTAAVATLPMLLTASSGSGGLVGVGAAKRKKEARLKRQHAARAKAVDLLEIHIQEGAIFEVNISSAQRAALRKLALLLQGSDDDGSGSGGSKTKKSKKKRGGGKMADSFMGRSGRGKSILAASSANVVPADAFDEAREEIFELMQRDSLPRFRASARWDVFAEDDATGAGAAKAGIGSGEWPATLQSLGELEAGNGGALPPILTLGKGGVSVRSDTSRASEQSLYASSNRTSRLSTLVSACTTIEGLLEHRATRAMGLAVTWKKSFFALEGAVLVHGESEHAVEQGGDSVDSDLVQASTVGTVTHGGEFTVSGLAGGVDLVLRAPSVKVAHAWAEALGQTAAQQALATSARELSGRALPITAVTTQSGGAAVI